MRRRVRDGRPQPNLIRLRMPKTHQHRSRPQRTFRPFIRQTIQRSMTFSRILSTNHRRRRLQRVTMNHIMMTPSLIIPPFTGRIANNPQPRVSTKRPFPHRHRPIRLTTRRAVRNPPNLILQVASHSSIHPVIQVHVQTIRVNILIMTTRTQRVTPIISPMKPAHATFLLPARRTSGLSKVITRQTRHMMKQPLITIAAPQNRTTNTPRM